MITFLGPHDNSIIGRGRGGSLGTPNLYYVIYGRPLKDKFCKQIGQNRPILSTAESETIYRGLYRVATAN